MSPGNRGLGSESRVPEDPSRSVPRLIDTHVHLDAEPFADDLEAHWDRARRVGVAGAIAVGVSPESWERTLAVARTLPRVGAALGIHPQVVPSLGDATIARAMERLPALLRESHAVAVGECGLDAPSGDLDRQRGVLLAHLEIARALRLPVSLHVYRAHGLALRVLADFGPLEHGGVAHSYSGPPELVREYLRSGISISFAGGITRANAKRPILAASAVPPEHLLVETDAPYQPSGADARDRRHGHPADLPDIVAALARARGESFEDVASATTANAMRIFAGLASV